MLSTDQINDLHRLYWSERWAIRKIERHLKISWKTIRKYLHAPAQSPALRSRSSKLDPFQGQIAEWLEQDPRVTAAVIEQRLRPLGYNGGHSILQEHVRKVRPQQATRRAFVRMEPPAGERFEVDWGHFGALSYSGDSRKLYAFALVEAHSRMLYVEFTHSQSFETFARCHMHAFTAMGGVAREIAYDNLATAVAEHDGRLVRFLPRFLGFAREYGFVPHACNPASGWEKGKVERAIGYLRQNFWPLREFLDLHDVNRQARQWLAEVANQRLHRETRERPLDRFKPEALRPLPIMPYDYRESTATKWVSGATLMAAVDAGKLSLDDPIGKYYPAFAHIPAAGATGDYSPNIRQCFSHTSGLPATVTGVGIARDHSVAESVELFTPQIRELEWKPGAMFRYGNTGMQIVGGIISKVTGVEFQEYMKEKILTPLGMTETTFNPTGDLVKRTGNIYVHKEGGGFQIDTKPPDGHVRGALVAGGLYSTIDDYARFLTMMLNDGRFEGHRVLSAKAALETQKDQTKNAPIKASPYRVQKGYGLGTAVVGVDAHGEPVYIGDGGAFGTYGWIERDEEIAGVFFTQNRLRDIYKLSMVDIRDLARAAVDSAKQKSKGANAR